MLFRAVPKLLMKCICSYCLISTDWESSLLLHGHCDGHVVLTITLVVATEIQQVWLDIVCIVKFLL